MKLRTIAFAAIALTVIASPSYAATASAQTVQSLSALSTLGSLSQLTLHADVLNVGRYDWYSASLSAAFAPQNVACPGVIDGDNYVAATGVATTSCWVKQKPAINLTNATGLPVSTGISGLGTGVATALGVNVGSAGAPVVNGGALGTPSSGDLRNLTGLNYLSSAAGILPPANNIVCVEAYATPAMGNDYGQIIQAANDAQGVDDRTLLRACVPGFHDIQTPVVLDRSYFSGAGSIYKIAWPSATRYTLAATLTAGSTTVTVTSTSGLTEAMAIGGLGTGIDNYIASVVNSTTLNLKKPAELVIPCITTTGSATVRAAGNMSGLATGQNLVWQGQTAGIQISSINYANQTITLASPSPNSHGSKPFNCSVVGSWSATLYANVITPAFTYIKDPLGPLSDEGNGYGGRISDLEIWDGAGVRATIGAAGLKIVSYDQFVLKGLTTRNIAGAGLIVGGYLAGGIPVRESNFYDIRIRNGGDPLTGQSSIAVTTPQGTDSAGGDEDNGLHFYNADAVFAYATGIGISTLNSAHGDFNGPRLITFVNSHVEGGSYHYYAPPSDLIIDAIGAPTQLYDSVHIDKGASVRFIGGELSAIGYGRSVVGMGSVTSLSMFGVHTNSGGKAATYTVSLSNGSSTVQYVSSAFSTFTKDHQWDGIGAYIYDDGGSCTTAAPCPVYLSPSAAVDAAGTTLTLASAWTGATSTSAKLVIGSIGGYQAFAAVAGTALTDLGGTHVYTSRPTWLGITTTGKDDVFTGAYFNGGTVDYLAKLTPIAGFQSDGPAVFNAASTFGTTVTLNGDLLYGTYTAAPTCTIDGYITLKTKLGVSHNVATCTVP